MIKIFTDSESNLDAKSISEMLGSYGLESEISISNDESKSSLLNILTNSFILRSDFNLRMFSDYPIFINAYTPRSLKKIGIKSFNTSGIEILDYRDQEYYTHLFIQKPNNLST